MRHSLVGTCIWIGLLGICIGYELWCWIKYVPEFPTFTQMTVRYVPASVAAAFWVWVLIHFYFAYLKK